MAEPMKLQGQGQGQGRRVDEWTARRWGCRGCKAATQSARQLSVEERSSTTLQIDGGLMVCMCVAT